LVCHVFLHRFFHVYYLHLDAFCMGHGMLFCNCHSELCCFFVRFVMVLLFLSGESRRVGQSKKKKRVEVYWAIYRYGSYQCTATTAVVDYHSESSVTPLM
jgi:hypothetical protein